MKPRNGAMPEPAAIMIAGIEFWAGGRKCSVGEARVTVSRSPGWTR